MLCCEHAVIGATYIQRGHEPQDIRPSQEADPKLESRAGWQFRKKRFISAKIATA